MSDNSATPDSAGNARLGRKRPNNSITSIHEMNPRYLCDLGGGSFRICDQRCGRCRTGGTARSRACSANGGRTRVIQTRGANRVRGALPEMSWWRKNGRRIQPGDARGVSQRRSQRQGDRVAKIVGEPADASDLARRRARHAGGRGQARSATDRCDRQVD